MKNFIKTYWKTILFFTLVGVIGGFFVGLYLLDSYPTDIQQQILAQGIDSTMLAVISAVQSAGYGLALGTLGILLAKRIGLWKDERKLTKKPLIEAGIVSVIGGLVLILSDIFFFGCYSEVIMNSYAVKPTIPYVIATVTYGAVIEEVMLRLFLMSLIAFIIHKIFCKKKEMPNDKTLIVANIIAAILFAAGHLPATLIMIGNSPMIIFRCFLLNGALGLLFGRLYRKYGLRYSMIAHGGCHVISKLIWILFI
jgi:membrane protease YdiL (CAAX protease family)